MAWAEAHLTNAKTGKPFRARPWQKFVMERGLEIDAFGRLVRDEAGVSGPRQIGKSWVELMLGIGRVVHAERFGEQQRVVQTANKLRAAYRIHKLVWRWAERNGYHVSRAVDSATVTAPSSGSLADGSAWLISSLSAVWGETATQALVDETWDIEPEVVEDGIQPTLLDPEQSQLWQFSTANAEATATYPRFYRKAFADPTGRAVLLHWGATVDDDPLDPVTWRKATPHWTAERERFMRAKCRQRGFAEQYLNIWPNLQTGGVGWPIGWSDLGRWQTAPRPGLVGAIEASPDRARYGVAVAELAGAVRVWTRSSTSIEGALTELRKWSPAVVLAGASIAAEVVGSWHTETVGAKETGWGTSRFEDMVRRGQIVHDGDPGMLREVETAKTSLTEGGPILSARRSEGPVPTVKAALWVSWAVVDGRFAPVEAEIW